MEMLTVHLDGQIGADHWWAACSDARPNAKMGDQLRLVRAERAISEISRAKMGNQIE